MSDQQATPDENKVDRTGVPAADAQIPADDLPETQDNDPLTAALGQKGQGDLAPEDELDTVAGDEPHDLRESTS